MKNSILIILALILCAGCAATGQKFVPANTMKSDEGIIYVYRPHRAANSGGYPVITLDGIKQGVLKDGGYLVVRAREGKHKVEQQYSIWNWDINANPVTLNIKPGNNYYVRLLTDASASIEMVGNVRMLMTKRGASFVSIDESLALEEIRNLNYSK